ncbi:MAG: glycoside hydrolase family 3 C-terminal domain-containing protein, partial [Acidobacteriaceae bacterium]
AIVFVHQFTHEGADLPTLELPGNQDDLVRQVAAANPHTIVIAETGGAFLMPWIDQVGAVLEAWYPGIRGGPAIANVLFGEVDPSGRLPITFPKSEADLPHPLLLGPKLDSNGHPQQFNVDYTEGLKVGYKWCDAEGKQPLFPFGFGLSYTTFSYSRLHVSSGKQVSVTFTVKNTGSRVGNDVAQIYLGLPPSAGEPPKRLVGWQKVSLEPGQSRTVTIAVSPRMLAIFNVEKDDWQILPGHYRIFVGSSSRQLPLHSTVVLHAAEMAP